MEREKGGNGKLNPPHSVLSQSYMAYVAECRGGYDGVGSCAAASSGGVDWRARSSIPIARGASAYPGLRATSSSLGGRSMAKSPLKNGGGGANRAISFDTIHQICGMNEGACHRGLT